MCCGLLRPDAGRVVAAGHDVWEDPIGAKRVLGVVNDPLLLFERLSGREHLRYTGALRLLDRSTVDRRSEELLDLLGLADAADRQISSYSHGMKKKLSLALAVLHRPRVLLLDEPFEGVDPVSVVALRDVLERIRGGGASIVISSHAMDLVERFCDHVAVLASGSVLASGATADVTAGGSLEDAFIAMVGARRLESTDLGWLSD
jgi:ABC-2 type transport system ATP-binding protein